MRLAIWARVMPHMARARFSSLCGWTCTAPASIEIDTSSGAVNLSSPLAPLTAIVWPSTLAVTPEGMGTGFLPIRDMTQFRFFGGPSEDGAEDFAADIVLAGGVVGHDALRRRDNRDAEAVADARHCVDGRIDAAARLRHALDLADDRLVVEIFQLDLELRAAIAVIGGRIAADVAFGLEHIEDLLAKGGAGRRHLAALAHLRVADPGEHVAKGIVHRHDPCLLTSSTRRGLESGPCCRVRARRCAT